MVTAKRIRGWTKTCSRWVSEAEIDDVVSFLATLASPMSAARYQRTGPSTSGIQHESAGV